MFALKSTLALGWARRARNIGILALGGAAFSSTAPAYAAAVFRCASSTATAGPGQNVNAENATGCAILAGRPDGSIGQFALQASSQAGNGILRGRSSTGTSDVSGNGFFLGASEYSQINDSFLVGGLANSDVVLNFVVHVDGILSAHASGRNAIYAPTAASDFEFRYSMNRGRTIFADGIVNACAEHADNGISTCNGNFSYGVSEDVVVNVDIPLSITVSNGDLVELGLFLKTGSLSAIGLEGQAASAESNFFNTVQWQGLVPDSAYAGVTLTSASGFDYGLSRLVSTNVPEPGTFALLSLGLLAMGRKWKIKDAIAPTFAQ